ncbi:MAG TPA: TolC family protein, partial [Bacteroidales bacterium]|nr:TolC family protein [Bacteroidales bacterium]
MNRILVLLFTGFLFASFTVRTEAQAVKKVMTLDEVIKVAEDQSPSALIAKHRFRASYWQYRSFKAQYLPSLTLTGTVPDFFNGLERVWDSRDTAWKYFATNTVSSTGSLSLSQAIGPLGTVISLSSDLTLYKDIEKNLPVNYITNPVSININQPIRRYNTLKWQAKIEPLLYEMAKKEYLNTIEEVHMNAVQNFFMLALAQINKQIAEMNYSNADTLYRIAQGRYQLGTIAE